ncbi:MAG: betaine/proline/choline family ABC transporter ATP-binding protein [Roseovarius sp.]
MTEKLKVEGLYKVYGERPEEAMTLIGEGADPDTIREQTGQVAAVIDASFKVDEGEIFTIMGLSGSGKSTLVRCLNRLIEPTRGKIILDGQDILRHSKSEMRATRRRKISMVFQNFALLPHKTVFDNVQLGLSLRGETRQDCEKAATDALAQVGLSGWSDRYPDDLSGGMKQRVGLARALASDPDILLMDEPFSALDPLIRDELQRELLKLQREIKKTIIFITHDFQEAVKLSDHLAVMRDGRFVQVGTPQDIVFRPYDTYVSNFSREMDRGKVLTAGMLASACQTVRVASTARAADVATALDAAGQPFALVEAADGAAQGYVGRADLSRSGGIVSDAMKDLPDTLASDEIVGNAYDRFLPNRPVAIVAPDQSVSGLVTADDVLSFLAGKTMPGINHAAGRAPAAEPAPAYQEANP